MRPGVALGSLCIIDTEPRRLCREAVQTLERFGAVALGLVKGHSLARRAERLGADLDHRTLLIEEQARELDLKRRRFRQTEAMARLGKWELSLETGLVTWSDQTYRICEIDVGTPVTLDIAFAVYGPRDRQRLADLFARAITEGAPFEEEFEIVGAAGTRKWVRLRGEVDHVGECARRLFGILQDVTERRTSQHRIWEAANRDALTALANRDRFNHDMEKAFADGSCPGLLMIDADHLKDINDTLGHSAGDLVLRTVASRIRRTVREGDLAARIGGDEFAVLVARPSPQELEELAEAILAAMEAPIAFGTGSIKPQVSIGGAIGCASLGAEALRQNADLALYKAKETRRGGYSFYHPALRSAIVDRMAAVGTVDTALETGNLVAWYQPVIESKTGRVSGVEVLARIRIGSQVRSIGEFASALEDHRIATRLTRRMFDCIVTDVAGWRAAGARIPRIAVNLGGPDFMDGAIEDLVVSACERAGLPLSNLALEVTESVFLSREADAVTRAATALRNRGAAIALDDFGTGYASLAHLSTFPVDFIKIDRSFVSQLGSGGPGSIISCALIDLAHRLGIAVVAEGVETRAQLTQLRDLGCEKLQGFLLSRPLPPNRVPLFLERFEAEIWSELVSAPTQPAVRRAEGSARARGTRALASP